MSYSQKINTIDLSAFIEKTLEIILIDGSTINVKRPTKEIALKIQALKETAEEEQRNMVIDIVYCAFNNNTENRKFTYDEISEMPDMMLSAIIQEYFRFMTSLITSPNSKSLPSRTSRTADKGSKKSK